MKQTQKFAEKRNAIAFVIRDRMKELGLSQIKFAKRMDIARPGITKILQGRQNMTIDTVCKIEKALNFNLLIKKRK